MIGSKIAINRQPGAVTVVGDDPKKFAAAMVEYSRDKVKIVFMIYSYLFLLQYFNVKR